MVSLGRSAAFAIAAVAWLSGLACDGGGDPERRAATEQARRYAVPEADWQEMLDSEELIVSLGPSLELLAHSIENLRVPDAASRALFDAVVDVTDLATAPVSNTSSAQGQRLAGLPVTLRRLAAGAAEAPTSPHGLDLWRSWLREVDYFDWAKLKVLRGRFADAERLRFDTKLELHARAHRVEGGIIAIRGGLDLRWRRQPGTGIGDVASWRIGSWRTGDFEILEAARPLFREVLDAVIEDPASLARARHSEHEALIVRKLTDKAGFRPPTPHFHLPSHDRHPGIAVADVDGNGHDDLYVMPRWGPNQLLLNRGDGHFEERAKAFGLDLVDHSSSAIFADFDNDGDADVFVGRTLAPSVYLENSGGRFAPPEGDRAADGLPQLVSSVSAVDYDGDGLLDLYVSTYAANIVVSQVKGRTRIERQGGARFERVLEAYLSDEDARHLHQLATSGDAHEYLSLPGPPNLLLTNRGGGRFEASPTGHSLRVFANTYQSTWSDFDADGDPDVYLAHDFSPNQMFRNDGDGRFTDITAETGTADIGFGMGVSWGDYDRDGREDLYVTNMYSKAGNRITDFFGELNPSFRKMARGNTLFRNLGDRFQAVSGPAEDDLPVEIAGWSWGGQFSDLDNDGFLDLYALSGYYTAPPEIESEVDI